MFRYSKLFINLILILLIPCIALYPQSPSQFTLALSDTALEEASLREEPFSLYDDMLLLFDKIESGSLESTCIAPSQIHRLKHYLSVLAKEGVLPDHSQESLSLERDIQDLLQGEDLFYEEASCFVRPIGYQAFMRESPSYGEGEIILCKNIGKKSWKKIKKFAKKHRKALLIGAAVVAAAAVVVAIVATSSTAAGVAGSAAGAVGSSSAKKGSSPSSKEIEPSEKKEESSSHEEKLNDQTNPSLKSQEVSHLKTTLQEKTESFKQKIVDYQFLAPQNPPVYNDSLSWEENIRSLGSLFAHECYKEAQNHILLSPILGKEVEEPKEIGPSSLPMEDKEAHGVIDRQFATNYSSFYTSSIQNLDFNTLTHQVIGEKALSMGYYHQAVEEFGKAIYINPTNGMAYLERGIAYFGLGQYDLSLQDYRQFIAQTPLETNGSISLSAFSVGFTKGLVKGVYESGEGFLLFLAEFAKHPIHTSNQIIESMNILVGLMKNEEWHLIAEALSPEICQLVYEWDSLPSEKKGELGGYALGKHGTDIFVPGAIVKLTSKGVKAAQELVVVGKKIQTAQKTLILETVGEIGNSATIKEVVQTSQKTAFAAQELGVSGSEMGQLKRAGVLEKTIQEGYENLTPFQQGSVQFYKKAEAFLKPYIKKPMPEMQARELIHSTGLPTFARPQGIPENYIVRITKNSGGMKYIHPTNNQFSVRVMPGKPHSPFPYQQKPYVVQMKDGKAFDKFGNKVAKDAPEAHIPIQEFIYRE